MENIIPGEMYAPDSPKKESINSFRSKKINKEKFISEDMLYDMTLYEFRIITLFEISVNRSNKVLVNQQLELSYTKLKHRYPKKESFYKAINSLIEKDIITKVPDVRSTYQFNYDFISNNTDQDAIAAGIKQDTYYHQQLRMKSNK